MQIQTKFLGEVDIQEEEIIVFEDGIPGLEEYRQFVILSLGEEMPFSVLQSLEEAQIGFILADPFKIKQDYAFDLPDNEKESLAIVTPTEVITQVVVSVKEPFEQSTINLLAPIIINVNNRKAKQIILQDNLKFPIRYPLYALEGSAK
ncbi:flagellar assembly protein FliW [Bacillaceae bacterium CLA-AA-H227]|uniref:Flagellar assembly protein FliW n=1 Tax=Robertmurraya yapensis (ex Hitch et al 2024) TaxID=3133160 RepID=A0ACC6SC30_9BACI